MEFEILPQHADSFYVLLRTVHNITHYNINKTGE